MIVPGPRVFAAAPRFAEAEAMTEKHGVPLDRDLVMDMIDGASHHVAARNDIT
jgi:hypothetical protein